tara:strand:- start:753 stop:947 length:195 start_codon:yes stop_codon:yes gene_type:complete
MKLHNPFKNEPTASLVIAVTILSITTLLGAAQLAFYYPFVVIPIVLVSAAIRVIYSVIKGDTDE